MEQKLSNSALEELRQTLVNDIGPEQAAQFTDRELDELGHTLLSLTAVVAKHKIGSTKA